MNKPNSERDLETTQRNLMYGRDLDDYEKSIINLGLGIPQIDIVKNCCTIFEKATSHRMKIEASNQADLFQYGPPSGKLEIRSEIAKFLTDAYQSNVKSDDIFITSGATQGLHIILSTLLDLNGYIFLDEVTFLASLGIFKQFTSLNIIPVKLNNDGVDVESLRALLKKTHFKPESKRFWGLYFAIPTHHNPTGIVFSDDVCKQLIKLAREFDILISCDDVYNALNYTNARPPKRLFEYDNPSDSDFNENVISNGTFSKIISPGIRLGWLEVSPKCKRILENSGVLNSGGCLNNYTAGIMASLFELGLAQAHIKNSTRLYQEQMLASIEVLRNNLPKSCSFLEPSGGCFIWIRMPENTSAYEVLKICMTKYKVYFIPGDQFSIKTSFNNYIRISIAPYKKELLAKAVLSICKSLEEYLNDFKLK